MKSAIKSNAPGSADGLPVVFGGSSKNNAAAHSAKASRLRSPARIILTLVFWLVALSSVHAADTSVTANVSSTSTTVDEPIRLTVTVTGARNASMPAHIDADGLDISFQSKGQRFEMSSGFGATMSTVITYIVTPEKAGKFTIPSISLDAGGETFNTNPITITVGKGAGSRSSRDDDDGATNPKIYSELLLPKDTAYVGEIIPVEVRFYFDNTVTFQLNPPGQVPQIDGEGFSKLRFPQARLEQKSIKGKDYRVLAYQTSLVAAKSGDLTVGPASLNFVVGMPQRQRRRNPFDDPFGADPFSSLFFNNQRIEREMTLHSDPAKLHIKALPMPRPDGFSGAVGQFTLQSTAKPVQVKMGDPITYRSTIAGRGNFDLVTAPVFASTDGWRSYSPTGKFTANDEMGVSGDKTFETAMVPEKKAAALPEAVFTYFDPGTEKFVTLRSPPIAVQIEGNALAAATPRNTAAPSANAAPALPTPAAVEPRLSPVKTALIGAPRNFSPLWRNQLFWALQGIPLVMLCGLLWPKIAAALAPNLAASRRAGLRREQSALASALLCANASTFLPAARRHLEIEAALAGVPHAGAPEVITALHFQDESAETVREIFSRSDELAYGGGSGRELPVEALRRYRGMLNPRSAAA